MSTAIAEVMNVIHRYVPTNFRPKVGMILGSGLASIAEQITNPISIPYQALPGLEPGHVAGHAYLLVAGHLNDVPVVCLKGRLHLYEGAHYESIRTLVRIVKYMGAHAVVITGAAGSLQPQVGPGEIMMITDHINFQPGNPLLGPNDESIGPRFTSLEDAYDSAFQEILRNVANRLHIPLANGVYLSTLGPSFETPAEIRAFQKWGADAIGMSVVPEVIIARHCGLRVACLAAITNLAVGLSEEKVTHEGTLHYGDLAARKLVKLIPEFIKEASSGLE